MTEYSEMVERKRKQLAAEEWARVVKHIHIHSIKSMWYDRWPGDTDNGSVTDTTYNDGMIERKLPNGGIRFISDDRLTGERLVDEWEKATHNMCVCGTQNCPTEYSCTTHGY